MAIRTLIIHVLCLANFGILIAEPIAMADPVATIKEGTLKGVIGKNIDGESFYEFFGIPYAKPPLKELRFQPPQPIDSWSGIRGASKVGDACISRDDFTRNIVGSEDCLYVNVYTKHLPDTNLSLKPVMVFIYGGGLTVGSSRPGIYGPEFLMLKDIVLVTFNYRLGILGFLSFDDPKLGVPGNMGLKDQTLALKWVQRNIRSFNGDPNNVTIFGNSAGSSSVHAHVLSPASKGLFHKAILQSGSVLNPWFWGSKNNALEIVSKAGKAVDTQAEALEILKNLTALEILSAQEKLEDLPYPADKRPFSAVQEIPNDSAFLSKNPVQTIKNGNYNQVPIMMGYTENEGMLLDLDKIAAEKIGLMLPDLHFEKLIPVNIDVSKEGNAFKEILATVTKLYSDKPINDRYDPMTDSYFLVGIIEGLRHHLKTAINPIYLYRVSLHGELNYLKRLMNRTHEPGVCHADELGYLFHTDLTPPITPTSLEDRSLRTFVELWTNFAINGNPTPNGNLNISWQPVDNENNIRVLDIGEKLEMRNIPERSRLDVWWTILKKWPLIKFS